MSVQNEAFALGFSYGLLAVCFVVGLVAWWKKH